MKACTQGSIDYFCGIYSTINAVKKACQKIRKFSYKEDCLLYQYLMQKLIDRGLISEVLHYGSSFSIMKLYLSDAKEYMNKEYNIKITYRQPFAHKKQSFDYIAKYVWCWLKRRNNSVIIRLKNKTIGDHWTVVTKCLPILQKLKLFDSYSYKELNTKYCRLKDLSSRTYIMEEGVILIKVHKKTITNI
ncbi:MAG: hypothetical protein E7012_06505 [Alphaproteobacteria bacterium]|nr:hypothetical protein [Alphaproteobacteria bacterium]